jgi:hypothetical protein
MFVHFPPQLQSARLGEACPHAREVGLEPEEDVLGLERNWRRLDARFGFG